MDTQSTTSLTYFMMYDVLVIWTSSQTPGRSHPLTGQRVVLTPGGVELMTDGRVVMLGVRGRGLRASQRPCFLPSTGLARALLMHLPRGRRGEWLKGGGWKGLVGNGCTGAARRSVIKQWAREGWAAVNMISHLLIKTMWHWHHFWAFLTLHSFFFCLCVLWLFFVRGGCQVDEVFAGRGYLCAPTSFCNTLHGNHFI